MPKIHLFESGSTKTTLLSTDVTDLDGSDVKKVDLPGYNPNRSTDILLRKLEEHNAIDSNDLVYFYGSGLGNEQHKIALARFFQERVNHGAVEVYDDITGAGRALYGNDTGILAIMGTGGCIAWYEKGEIHERRGGYGYLIDDVGGGYELGKLIISHWLNNDWPTALDNEISATIGIKKEIFTGEYYRQRDLALVAALPKLIVKYTADEMIRFIVIDYFKTFFMRHLLPLAHKKGAHKIKTTGSIAKAFNEIIRETGNLFNLTIENETQYPALDLLKYHLRGINK